MNLNKIKMSIRKSAEYLVFWGISMVVLANHFAYGPSVERIDWIYTLLFHLSLWIGVSVNSFALIPQFLAKKRYIIYTLGLSIVIVITIFLNQLTFTHITDWLFPGYFFISYFEWYDLLVYVIAYLGITSLVQFSRSWFEQAEAQKSIAELRKAKIEQELRSLKAQIQPHFLFNSLNTIYGLVRRRSDQAGDAIITLSELLRYTIRHSESSWVSLTDELEYLQQYLNLQRLRTDNPEKVMLDIELSGQSPDRLKVLPLLFLPFVENAFKYGDGEVDASFRVSGDELIFRCMNPIVPGKAVTGTGTGIENTRKLLDLMYQDKYVLDLKAETERFLVELRIPLESQHVGDKS
jgi:sensor histidine kinase YesM